MQVQKLIANAVKTTVRNVGRTIKGWIEEGTTKEKAKSGRPCGISNKNIEMNTAVASKRSCSIYSNLLRRKLVQYIQYRARCLRGNARDSHSGGPGFKSRCRPTWLRFFRGFPQSSRQILGWIFITTIHLTIIHQIHIS